MAKPVFMDPATPSVPIASLPGPPGPDGLPCVCHGGGGARTSILCGTFRFGPAAAELLLPLLPPLLVARGDGGPTSSWMDATLRLLADELGGALPGAETVVSRLADVLFVHVLRAWMAQHAGEVGWLAAMTDPPLGRALAAMHARPERPWTAAELARVAGLSRSAFFDRFSARVGEAPAAYLARWRMHLARQALREGATLAEVATQVGYGSEAAFSKAFKRQTGSSPGEWRATVDLVAKGRARYHRGENGGRSPCFDPASTGLGRR